MFYKAVSLSVFLLLVSSVNAPECDAPDAMLCPLSLSIYPENMPLQCSECSSSPLAQPDRCSCEYLQFKANVTDCNNETIEWKNDLDVCIDGFCQTVAVRSVCSDSYPQTFYELLTCLTETAIVEMSVKTTGFIDANVNVNLNVSVECHRVCSADQEYCPFIDDNSKNNDNCTDNETMLLCADCPLGSGVPINIINTCVECENYLLDLLYFMLIEIAPITIMTLLIIVLNIQITGGFLHGIVFYSQMVSLFYFDYPIEKYGSMSEDTILVIPLLPCGIFNLNLMPFLFNYPLCIAPQMSPLLVISFWYVIGFYPLLLLLLLYVWITLYNKGYKCVVFITRPFHRCMARFWSMTGIEPSFTHSIASIYILCFTKVASISFKILHLNLKNGNALFFYDAKQKYFHNFHGVAGSFAILVLLLVILLPTLYIQFYPFKWFHKMLDCLHLRKQLLLSLGDVFTGPYKNGSEKTSDYRYIAGFYLFTRFLCQNVIIVEATLMLRLLLFTSLGVMILILRPFQITYQNISEFIILLFLILVSAFYYVKPDIILIHELMTFFFSSFIFSVATPVLILYKLGSICKHCFKQCKGAPQVDREPENDDQLIIEDEWNPDRIENPQEYNEQHVPVVLSLEDRHNTEDTNAATYGSIRQDTSI